MGIGKNSSIVEDALLQIKNLEEAINENAKGILASTMKEEISELVKESLGGSKKYLHEQEEDDEMPAEPEDEMPEPEEDEGEMEGEEEGEESDIDPSGVGGLKIDTEKVGEKLKSLREPVMGDNEGGEMPPLDMTTASHDELLKVFKAMGDEDGIVVKKDDDYVHLSDSGNDVEYLIQMGGEEAPEDEMTQGQMAENTIYELEVNSGDEIGMDEMDFSDYESLDFDMAEETIYELEMGGVESEGYDPEAMEGFDPEAMEGFDPEAMEGDETVYEIDQDSLDAVMEAFKAVGLGFGKPRKTFSKTDVNMKGFSDDKKYAGDERKRKGPKFKYPKIKHGVTESEQFEDMYEQNDYEFEGYHMDEQDGDYAFEGMGHDMYEQDDNAFEGMGHDMYEQGTGKGEEDFEAYDMYEQGGEEDFEAYDMYEQGGEEDFDPEMAEASRTLGNGKYWGRDGLPKHRSAPRAIRKESVRMEMNLLREKNEEYRKALDFFRNKLNEVAVFNSNLAYSTRLFTEHSTTKQEKINILRRFDDVETLKESKSLYKTIKTELDGKGSTNTIKESIQRRVVKTPSNGSSSNLIETKTYENPQFLRMKDLMNKIK